MFSTTLSVCNLLKLKSIKKEFFCVFQEAEVDHVNSKMAYLIFSILTHTPKGCPTPFMHSQ